MLKKTAANKFNNPEGKYTRTNPKGDTMEFSTQKGYDVEGEGDQNTGQELPYVGINKTGSYKKDNIILLNNGIQITLDSGSEYIIDTVQRFIRTQDYLATYYLWKCEEGDLDNTMVLIDEFKPKMEGINKYIYKIIKDVLRNEAEPNYRSPYILSWIYRKAFGRKTKQEAIQLLSSWKDSPDMTEPDLPNDSLF